SGESVSMSEPDGEDMVFIARFPSLKRFHLHTPVGRRLPIYCTASGRAYLAALAPAEAQRIVRGSQLRPLTPLTLTDPRQILKRIAAAREAGYEWSDQECYRGDLTIAAAVLGADGQPLAALNISAPTSRWTLAELRSKLAPLLLQTARAASQGDLALPSVRSFTEFARAGLGAWAGFVAGWLYWYFWIIVVPVEAIAGARILADWLGFPAWLLGLVLMGIMTAVNLMSARSYGEFEF